MCTYIYIYKFSFIYLVGSSLIHELSLDGPYTAFLPSNEAMQLINIESFNKLYNDENKLSEFVLNHVTKEYWLYRDLYGSSYQPVNKNNKRKMCINIYIYIYISLYIIFFLHLTVVNVQ